MLKSFFFFLNGRMKTSSIVIASWMGLDGYTLYNRSQFLFMFVTMNYCLLRDFELPTRFSNKKLF